MKNLLDECVEVEFTISSEQNVREVFMLWAAEKGYEVVESGEQCPDLRVRKNDGEIERFEVEKLASDFIAHNHDPDDADRIVCWRDDLGDEAPLPVIPLEKEVEADDTLRSPKYVAAESGSQSDGWFNQLLVWSEKDTPKVKFRYYQHENGEWKQKSSGTPSLTAKEFVSIFSQVPISVRRDAFCEASFDALRNYVEDEIEPNAFSSSVDQAADLGKYHQRDGGTISFGVSKSNPAFAVRAYNKNNIFRSQGAAQFYETDYPQLFGDLKQEFAETLFIDLDVDAALDLAKERGYPTAKQRKPN